MTENVQASLDEMARGDRDFGALYRAVARALGLSESAMWVLYFADTSRKPLSQQEIVEATTLPKQTVNSAISSLMRKGLVSLEAVPGTRNRKNVLLTEEGDRLAARTVRRLRVAEEQAVTHMGHERLTLFVELRDELIGLIAEALAEEGIINVP